MNIKIYESNSSGSVLGKHLANLPMCTASRQAGKQGKPGSQHELPKALPEVLATLGLGEKQSTHHWPWSSARADNIQGMNCKWLQMDPNGSKWIQILSKWCMYTNSLLDAPELQKALRMLRTVSEDRRFGCWPVTASQCQQSNVRHLC